MAILDFIHALSYVFAAATAGASIVGASVPAMACPNQSKLTSSVTV